MNEIVKAIEKAEITAEASKKAAKATARDTILAAEVNAKKLIESIGAESVKILKDAINTVEKQGEEKASELLNANAGECAELKEKAGSRMDAAVSFIVGRVL